MAINILSKNVNQALVIMDGRSILSLDEMKCHCNDFSCNYVLFSTDLGRVFYKLRVKYGHPIQINCGFRCARHNLAIGGVSLSQHMTGQALDLCPLNKPTGFTLIDFASIMKDVGFTYTQVYDNKNFVHGDIREL